MKFGFNPINAAPSGNIELGIINPDSAWNGSKAFLNMLNKMTDNVTVTEYSFNTQNGQSVPFQVVDRVTYVKGVTSTEDEDGSTETTIDVDESLPGFSMSVIPKVTSKNEINMQIALNITKLNSLDSFITDNGMSQAQLPQETQQSLSQNVIIKNGQTMMLTGYEEKVNESTVESMGGPSAWIAGGKKSGGSKTKMTIVLLTPYIMAN